MHDAPAFPTDAARLDAVRRRDPAADGAFVFSVLTTGVFCRPSCAARPARAEHIAFHATPADAVRAGYRPCRRCRPDGPSRAEREAVLVATACRSIDAAEDAPRLEHLATAAGLSPQHFHRLFRRVAGVTPRAYADARRQERVRAGLAAGAAVTEASYAAGFNSSGRFYAAAPGMLGMTPTRYRGGGAAERVGFATAPCSLGHVLVAATPRGVCAILLGDDPAALETELRARFPAAAIAPADDAPVRAAVALVDDPAAGHALPLDIRGTAFQRRVWEALRQIPAGTVTSYAALAAELGAPRAVRAVAGACAANPLAVAVPCHRVVARDGALTGYRWGIERKRALLARERP